MEEVSGRAIFMQTIKCSLFKHYTLQENRENSEWWKHYLVAVKNDTKVIINGEAD